MNACVESTYLFFKYFFCNYLNEMPLTQLIEFKSTTPTTS